MSATQITCLNATTTVRSLIMKITAGFTLFLSLTSLLQITLMRSGRVTASMGGTCPVLWEASTEFACPANGIDGKKTPISFAIPLPTTTEHAALLEACGGGVRISASFRPRECDLENTPLMKQSLAVELRLPDEQDTGAPAPLPPDMCYTAIPVALIGTAKSNVYPSALIPAYGVVTTRVTCCQSCPPVPLP